MSPARPSRISGAIALAIAASACAPLTEKPTTPAAPPQISQSTLRERAQEQLALGIRQYNAGEFESAQKSLTGALDHGLLSKADQSSARKHLAFIHCLVNRETQCRDEFRKAFEINSDFALTPAEDGHPIWGPVYRNVRAQLIVESEAKQVMSRTGLAKAEQTLADGMVKYESGDYAGALKLLEAATREGLKEKPDQVRALKHTAFSLCLLNRYPQCRATFIRIYDVNPDFDLTPAEAGHPSWTKTFAAAKAEAKRALAAKQKASTTTAKDKAPAPPAAAQTPPKKN